MNPIQASCGQTERANPIPLEQALAIVIGACAARSLDVERVALFDALGRRVADDIHAPVDVPAFANSAMDGYALRSVDARNIGTCLHECGVALAGHPFTGEVGQGRCVRITTGAPIPDGCDAVLIKERARHPEAGWIEFDGPVAQGEHVRAVGEDIRRGDGVMRRGELLTPPRMGVLASLGLAEVRTFRRARVGVISSGDELLAAGEPPRPGCIHDSNRVALAGLLTQLGADVRDFGHVADDRVALRERIEQCSRTCDLVLTSGGVSAGEADHLPALVREQGRLLFWKIRLKPGMPAMFAEWGNALLFALPGNPVSVMVTALVLVAPALRALAGADPRQETIRARLAEPLDKTHARAEYLRVRVESRGSERWVRTSGTQGSGVLTTLARADALAWLPEGAQRFEAGCELECLVLPWSPVA